MAKPHESHWLVAKRVLHYLKGTYNYGIEFNNNCDVDDKRSTIGYLFKLGSGAISWSSKRKPTISLSSTKAKYNALCNSTCEVVWLQRVFEYVGEK